MKSTLKNILSDDGLTASHSEIKQNQGVTHSGKSEANCEVNPKKQRRRFTAEYKLKILQELDLCGSASERGSFLRREGLFSSCISDWRKARKQGVLSALSRIPGRKPIHSPKDIQITSLEKEITALKAKLEQAEIIMDVQKKVSEIFGCMNQKNQTSEKK